MEPKEALKIINKDIRDIEMTVYHFEEVLRPRIEADKKVLDDLRSRRVKLAALIEKMKGKEEVTKEEINEALPESLR